MLLVVFQAAKIKIHFGELLLSALLLCQRINRDMLWSKFFIEYKHFVFNEIFQRNNDIVTFPCTSFRELAIHLTLLFVVLWGLTCMTVFILLAQHALALL